MHVTNSGISQNQQRQKRRGFTLVELLVVIAIIGILAALLIPAVFFAVRTARRAKITLELANIQRSLENYKQKMGEYPPDFSHVAVSGAPPRQEQIVQAIERHLSRTFRNRTRILPITANRLRDEVLDVPQFYDSANNQWTSTQQIVQNPQALAQRIAQLDPAEALYFWLRGFSNDPQHPLAGPGDRQPLFEFDPSRLVDRDGDGFQEYYPPGDSAQKPYVYYVAQPGLPPGDAYSRVFGYVNSGPTTSIEAGDDDDQLPMPVLRTYGEGDTERLEYCNPKKFQLLCAGLDGVFGRDSSMGPRSIDELGPPADSEKDDMANFLEGQTMQDYRESK